MNNTIELIHGDIKAKLLFCTRSSLLWGNEVSKLRKESLTKEEIISDIQSMDKYIYGLYICHQCYCEDMNIDVKVKRSQFYDVFFTKQENSNAEECLKQFAESMQAIQESVTDHVETKKKKPTIKASIN
jgi:hypothetical protein